MKKVCPKCQTTFEGHPNKRFCNQVCKDGYHNHIKAHGKGSHLHNTQDKSDGIRHVKGICKCCGTEFEGHKNKKFCDSTCKDRYHNFHNPRGIALDIRCDSPNVEDEDNDRDECLDAEEYGWDGHKVW